MKIGIAGITGKFARRLVAHLENDDITIIKSYCRNPAKLPEALRSSPKLKLKLIQGDAFGNNAIGSFIQGCDVIVCCYLGDDKLMVDGQKLHSDACNIETSVT